jgi:hypothetical protein
MDPRMDPRIDPGVGSSSSTATGSAPPAPAALNQPATRNQQEPQLSAADHSEIARQVIQMIRTENRTERRDPNDNHAECRDPNDNNYQRNPCERQDLQDDDNHQPSAPKLTTDIIRLFDPTFTAGPGNSTDTEIGITQQGKITIYTDVFLFTDRL